MRWVLSLLAVLVVGCSTPRTSPLLEMETGSTVRMKLMDGSVLEGELADVAPGAYRILAKDRSLGQGIVQKGFDRVVNPDHVVWVEKTQRP